ncbi:MAG: T9SS type A sorting domain-containing protein [Candidatus Neomarinimicrobiota bacterium]
MIRFPNVTFIGRRRLTGLLSAWLILSGLAVGQLSQRELLFLPWGTADTAIGLRDAPEARYGPAAFAVSGDSIRLLDDVNGQLKLYHSAVLVDRTELPDGYHDDFLYVGRNHFFLSADNQVNEVRDGTIRATFALPDRQETIADLSTGQSGQLLIRTGRSQIYEIAAPGRLRRFAPPAGSSVTRFPEITKEDWRTFLVQVNDQNQFRITADTDDFGSARILGRTPTGSIYIYLETIAQAVPLRVERQVRLYAPGGTIQAVFEVPNHSYARVFREFHIDRAGNLYHLLTARDGIHVLGWFPDPAGPPDPVPVRYPDRFRQFEHYNLKASPGEIDPVERTDQRLKSNDFPAVTRAAALAIGDTYVQHSWTATSANITGGRITDPDGVAVETPDWVRVGTNNKVPYKWGGFDTLDSFDAGLLAGKYAGDNATTGVSRYCVGVDCSGFVSRCWKLPNHYSTAMMDDDITIAYSSWSLVQPADAVHKVGHVRLAVSNYPNGEILTVESAGRDWRVSYRSYSYYELTDYTPRYYRYIADSTRTAQPLLTTVTFDAQVHLTWDISDTSFLAGYAADYFDGSAWLSLTADQLLPADRTSVKYDWPIDGAPLYTRLASVSTDAIVSPRSDGYGCFDAGTADRVLIVDGFDCTSGSYSKTSHEFALSVGQSVAAAGIAFATAANDALLAGTLQADDYTAVFWLLGDESTADETLSSEEQQIVRDYLRQGGRLFISGSELAWDLDWRGTTADQAFIRDYLKVKLDNDDANSNLVNGEAGTIFENVSLQFDDGSHGVYREDYPDSYLVQSGGEVLLRYDNDQVAAVGFRGKVSNGKQPARVLVLGFPVETVYDRTERDLLVSKVLEFLDVDSTTAVPPESFALQGNYPNPFPDYTTIAFENRVEQQIRLTVYDLLGRQVATVTDEVFPVGPQTVKFVPDRLASGLYIYVLRSDKYQEQGKMVLIK